MLHEQSTNILLCDKTTENALETLMLAFVVFRNRKKAKEFPRDKYFCNEV